MEAVYLNDQRFKGFSLNSSPHSQSHIFETSDVNNFCMWLEWVRLALQLAARSRYPRLLFNSMKEYLRTAARVHVVQRAYSCRLAGLLSLVKYPVFKDHLVLRVFVLS